MKAVAVDRSPQPIRSRRRHRLIAGSIEGRCWADSCCRFVATINDSVRLSTAAYLVEMLQKISGILIDAVRAGTLQLFKAITAG
jgi:hypothetical protein